MIFFKKQTEQEIFDAYLSEASYDGTLGCLGRLLERAAKLYPEKIALMFGATHITYKALYYRATRFSELLRARGVNPRDRVLLWYENSIEFYVAYFGVLQIGGVVAPLNTFLHEKEFAYILQDSKPVMIIADAAHAERIGQLPLPNVPPIITGADIDMTSPIPGQMPPFEITCLSEDEMTMLLYTSGTTGFPKGVMLSSKNCVYNALQGAARFGFLNDERLFGVLPLFHSFAQNACIWAPFYVGCTVIIVPKIERRAILEGLKNKPSVFLGVPALFGLLCLMKNAPLGSVRCFISGGDALPDKIRSLFALVYHRKIRSGYGLTEASPFVSFDLDEPLLAANTVGVLVRGLSCKFTNDKGAEVPAHEGGLLWLKGDNVMLGYYNAPDITKETIRDGWLCTGDLGYLDERDKLVITGRTKDLIINKGIKIYPQEIENVIMTDPRVIRVGVIGQEDEAVGQVPVAFVQIRHEQAGIEQALRDLCAKSLAPYKVPRHFFCTTKDLPTTATGKVDKKKLREQLASHGA